MPEKIQACQDLNLDLCDPGTTNYAVAKASLHLHQIKSLRSCHFLITFFCYYFILLTFFLFISFSFRPCWKNKWVSPSCSKRFGQKRTKNVHSWWNVLSCKGSVLSCGKKTQAAISAQVFIQECSHNLQHIVRWPGRNWTACLLQQCHFFQHMYRHWEKLLPENINAINTTLDDSSGCCRYNMLELLKL